MAKNDMSVGVRPLGDRVVVRPAEKEEKTASGILIPDSSKEKPVKGTVVAVGPGRMTDAGKHIPVEVKVGDKVLYKKPWDEPIKLDGVEYYVLSENEITLVLK